jgi:hypothetical protein
MEPEIEGRYNYHKFLLSTKRVAVGEAFICHKNKLKHIWRARPQKASHLSPTDKSKYIVHAHAQAKPR